MAYSFQNPYMSTLSNILIIHAALDKGETADTTETTAGITTDTTDTTAETTAVTTADTTETTADTTALDKDETADTTAFTIPREVMARVMKTSYGKFVVTNSIPCLRVVLEDGTISSAKVSSDGVVTLTAPAKGKLIIDGTLDIECNY
jgi:hypothetical protein